MKTFLIISILIMALIAILIIKTKNKKLSRYYTGALILFIVLFASGIYKISMDDANKKQTSKKLVIEKVSDSVDNSSDGDSEESSSNTDTKSTDSSENKNKKSSNSTTKKRFDNDDLSNLSTEEIYNAYSEKAKKRIDSVFTIEEGRKNTEDEDIAKNYALTLIGKTIPDVVFNDINNKEVKIKGKTVILTLNRGELSTKFVKSSALKDIKYDDNVQYLIVAPTESNEDMKKFVEENNIDSHWDVVASTNNWKATPLQPDILNVARYYFNSLGSPSYVSVVDNAITMAGSGFDENVFKRFYGEAFEKPYLFNEVLYEKK